MMALPEKKARRPKRTKAEKILHEARLKPSPFSDDPRQLDFMDAIKQRAFAKLDEAIKRTLEGK